MRTIRKILVATDFSPCASDALDQAIGLAQLTGAAVTLLHACQLPVISLSELPSILPFEAQRKVEDTARRELAELLDSAVRRSHAQGDRRLEISTRMLDGAPDPVIVDEAAHGGFDLVVLGTHGRTGLKHLLLGSVAERVVRLAACP